MITVSKECISHIEVVISDISKSEINLEDINIRRHIVDNMQFVLNGSVEEEGRYECGCHHFMWNHHQYSG